MLMVELQKKKSERCLLNSDLLLLNCTPSTRFYLDSNLYKKHGMALTKSVLYYFPLKICLHLQIIGLSASANRLSTIQKQADEYAAMIMEELDPNNLGYIMVI